MPKGLTHKQRLFAEAWIECGNATEAAKKAGYSEGTAGRNADKVRKNTKVSAYIDERMKSQDASLVASADEVLRFYTDVMRGKVKDQFGLDASLADRLNAAKELMKRHAAAEGRKANDAPRIIDRRPE